MRWLVAEHEREAFADVYARLSAASGMTLAECAKQLGMTVEKVKTHDHGDGETMSIERGELSIVDGAAIIPIKGMLVPRPDFFLSMFGVEHTAYETLIGSIAQAEADEDVDRIVFEVDSPGGLQPGLTQAADAIFAIKKPKTAQVSNLCASAAYWLASQCDTISASNRSDRFGSIGAMTTIFVSDSEVNITSRNAPRKAPDVRTNEGVSVVQDQLDDFAAIFVDAVARGRRMSTEDINANFGRGGILLADRALSVNMIDTVEPQPQTQETTMTTEANSVTGIRAALGLDKNVLKEDLIAHCVMTKEKCAAFDAMKPEYERTVALLTATKEQLTAQATRLAELEASEKTRAGEAFETKRNALFAKAQEDGKIVPAQVDSLKAIAKDEEGLKEVSALISASSSLALGKPLSAFGTPPKGANGAITDPAKYSKVYKCSVAVAERAIASREAAQ